MSHPVEKPKCKYTGGFKGQIPAAVMVFHFVGDAVVFSVLKVPIDTVWAV